MRIVRAFMAARQAAAEKEAARIQSLATQVGLSVAETQTILTSSQQGAADITNMIAFQDRIKLEANLV